MNNLFEKQPADQMIERINKLKLDTPQQWGKMSVDQMLAHCNVTYEMVYDNKHPKTKGIMKFMLKTFIKKLVVGDKPYPKNGRTAPQFLIKNEKNFEVEKERLINFINKTRENGAEWFEGKESNSFGKLTSKEWNNMFCKHLDHHLKQFGV